MLIRATFIGEDGSLGYRKGEDYTLRIIEPSDWPILIERENGDGRNAYGGLSAFLSNWWNVQRVREVGRGLEDGGE